MTTPGTAPTRRAMTVPEIPKGDIVSTYDSYHDAQLAVDTLARANFPVARLSILGNDIRSVERVTGKLTYGRVALMGALSGAYLGLFFGLILFIFQPDNTAIAGVFIAALAMGAGFGMLFGVLSYALNRNRRDFSSVMQLVATRYDLITEPELISQARQILGGGIAKNGIPGAQ
ncbi:MULTISPECIES: general stress protein [unclassified Leucobacter]|uniref:general stress protein n=1 Tax=unclassified Leucobacter TaxID=2621730 RepID=UPI001F144BE7|nr:MULTISPECIES: general stress protein [unclassified Leucobacter]